VTVSETGQVQATVNNATTSVGQLELTRFPNESGLKAVGNNLLLETESSGAPQAGTPGSTGYGTIKQKYLESSNVDSVTEITSMITAQRAYEMNSKVITAADNMMQEAASLGSS
jgi:flagellar basal-body rod protein FlgG